jgi:outer membrane protein TolC
LAVRQTKLADAEQKRKEAEMHLMTLYSDAAFGAYPVVRVTDEPQVDGTIPEFLNTAEAAFDLNPDYQTQLQKIKQEDIRLAYAKNQKLPQLDLSLSYGLNGLGDSPSASMSDIERQSFPSWSVGFELHVPLAGNLKARNEYSAGQLRKEQALLALKQIETQIINAVQSAVQKIRSARDSVENNHKIVAFNQDLLKTQMDRLDVGKVESRKVLEVEAALFESKNAVIDSLVQYERAQLELELVQGAILKARQLDFTRDELQSGTITALQKRQREKLHAAPAPSEKPPTQQDLRQKLNNSEPSNNR